MSDRLFDSEPNSSPVPWKVFRDELKTHMALRDINSPKLARALGGRVSADTVNNWRKNVVHPKLELLPLISKALGMGAERAGEHDPAYLLTRMGLLPDVGPADLFDATFRIQKLELRYREAMERAATTGRRHGASIVTAAVLASGRYAMALWPAYEGIEECRMHVADRIDVVRLDGRSCTDDEVFDDPTLHEALRRAYAVRSRRTPRWSSPEEGASSWAVSHVGTPMSPWRSRTHPALPSALCYALTVGSWVNDVAYLLAIALGYGLATTRDLAMDATGISVASTTATSRAHAHEYLLSTPPARRIWSHHAPPGPANPNPFDTRGRTDIPRVWLRESDEVLARHAARAHQNTTLADLLDARERVDDMAQTSKGPLLSIPVNDTPSVDERWRQVLRTVRKIYHWYDELGLLTPDARDHWHDAAAADPEVAGTFLRWMNPARN